MGTARIRTNDQQIQWKDNTIQAASDSYRSRQLLKKQRQQAQQKLESIQWFNPFKLKENRLIKEQAEMKIARATDEIKESGKRLLPMVKSLVSVPNKNFSTYKINIDKIAQD